MKIDEKVLALLSCPVCNSSLALGDSGLLCDSCHKIYPIENEIIILLPEKALPA